MQTSLHGRALPKLIIVSLIALAMGLLFMGSDTSQAAGRPGTACPSCPANWQANTYQSVSSNATGANADLTLDLQIEVPSYNFYAVNFFTPPAATLKAGPGNPGADANAVLGDYMGHLQADININALSQACNTHLSIPFELMNATTDNAGANVVWPSAVNLTAGNDLNGNPILGTLDPLSKDDPDTSAGAHGVANGALGAGSAASINNDLPTGVDRYPGYLNTLFGGVQPWARYLGINIVSNFVQLNFLIFAPGGLAAVPAPNPSNDMGLANLGYSAVTVLNDPTAAAAPGVTDFCSQLLTVATMYGITKTNPCNGGGIDDCQGVNEAALWSSAPGGSTGRIRYANPASAGTYLYPTFHLSPRDLDMDGYENGFDTCPYTPTPLFAARVTGGAGYGGANDSDSDMIPGGGAAGGCDVNLGSTDQNEDGDDDGGLPAKQWQNAQDNCPLVPNGDQLESELTQSDTVSRPRGGSDGDSIGDACDTAESGGQCTGAADDDADTLVNDGCPAVGAAEVGCLNSADDDADGTVNDGCASSNVVANGAYYATFTLSPVCIGGTDADNDGWCSSATPTSFPYGTGAVSLSDPNDANNAITVEHYAITFPFPIAHSGARSDSAAAPARQPAQACNDGIDNDGDTTIDLLDSPGTSAGCKPPAAMSLGPADTDGDGFQDEAEVWVNTDALGRCEKGSLPSRSTDWPADLSNAIAVDKINISDVSAYVGSTPIYGTTPGAGSAYDQRFDLVPGPGGVPGAWINISDLQAIATGTAPMFGGGKMYGGAACTAGPYND